MGPPSLARRLGKASSLEGVPSPFSPPFDSEPLCVSALTPFPPLQAFSYLLAAVWTEFGAWCCLGPDTDLLGLKHVLFLYQLTAWCVSGGLFAQFPLKP